MINPLVQDIQALRQVIESMGRQYEIIRKVLRGHNDKGRIDNIVRKDTITAFIVPEQKRINTSNEGSGSWVVAQYAIYVVNPDYISMGDIILTQYGRLKVISLTDLREEGVMSGNLTRTGTTDRIVSNKENEGFEPL